MKKSSKSGEVEESGRNQELLQQLNDLEKEWDTLKKGKLQNTRRRSTNSDRSFINSFDLLLENSPRGLMNSLQRRKSPFDDEFLRERNCDMAVVEVLRERRAAIMSGKLKGRRLFGAAEAAELDLDYDDGGGGGGSDWLNVIGKTEVVINENRDCIKGQGAEVELPYSFSPSCSFADASLSEEKEVVVEEKVVVEKRRGVGRGGDGSDRGGRSIMAMGWLVFLVILLILGLDSMSCNGKFVNENDVFLVPT